MKLKTTILMISIGTTILDLGTANLIAWLVNGNTLNIAWNIGLGIFFFVVMLMMMCLVNAGKDGNRRLNDTDRE